MAPIHRTRTRQAPAIVVSFSIFIVVATPFCQLSLELFEYCFQIFNVRTHVTIYTKHFYFVNIDEKLVVWSRDT
jgi:hypothetical protein